MSDNPLYNITLIVWLIISLIIFISLFFIIAPYGRHARKGWGSALDNTLGWVLMEAFSPAIFAILFVTGKAPLSITSLAFLFLWEVHYIHRAFIYPFSLKNTADKMPISVIILGCFFNIVNASINGYYVFTLSGGYSNQWLMDPRFIIGAGLFISGFVINRQSDFILSKLRKKGETVYKIPEGGLYGLVACPNYLGEILIWTGWAIATWSLAGLSFALWTAANLIPRAKAHRHWYQEHFSDYPSNRKTLIPGIW
jgi:3-oxo-5-alpha-steroid 4-dehydrogenase 1